MAPPDATGGDGNDDAASDPMQQQAEKVATMAQQQQLAVTTQKKKPKKKRKKLKPSSSPAAAHYQQQQQRCDGDASIGHLHLQQQRGRPRVVWDDELHGAFVEAYNALGKKFRLSLKREEHSIADKGDKRPPLNAQAASLPSPHPPPAQSPASTSSSLRICLSSNSAAANLLIHPCPDFPMVQPIQQFTPPREATVPVVQPIQPCFTPPDLEAIIATMPQKLVEKQGAGRDATALLQAAAAAASGYNPMQACQDVSVTGGGMLLCQAVSMTGEQAGSVPEAEICVARLQMAANAEEVQGGAAQPGAADQMAAKAEEGQGSMDPPGSSVVHAYWKIDDNEVSSWDFGLFPWYKID